MKKGTPITIKSNGHKATTLQAVYKNSTWVRVHDWTDRQDCMVHVDDIEDRANAMKYVAFRIDRQCIKGMVVVDGWFVLGQRDTDLNWSYLGEGESEDDAKAVALDQRQKHGTHANNPIYNPAGYAYMQDGQML